MIFHSLNSKVFLVGCLLLPLSLAAQDDSRKPIQTETALQQTQKNVENTSREYDTLKAAIEALKVKSDILAAENENFRTALATAIGNKTEAQKKLYTSNYELIKLSFDNIASVDRQLKTFNNLVDVAIAGTLITGINSPTNNELGKSFSDVVLENSRDILTKGLNNKPKARLLTTIQRIIQIPIISTLVQSNPITNLASNVFQQAVGFDDNAISSKALTDFSNSLVPYQNFYGAIDNRTATFRSELSSFKKELTKYKEQQDRYSNALYKVLNAKPENAISRLDSIFRRSSLQSLQGSDMDAISNSSVVLSLLATMRLQPAVDLDQSPFNVSYNGYLDGIVKILRDAKDGKLGFDNVKVDELAEKLSKLKIQ